MSVKLLRGAMPSESPDFIAIKRIGSTAKIFMGEFSSNDTSIAAVDNSFDGNSKGIVFVDNNEAGLYFNGNQLFSAGATDATMQFNNASINVSSPAAVDTIAIGSTGVGEVKIAGAADKIGYFTASPVVKQLAVPVTSAGIHAALVAYGLIT